ncbi:MAG: ribose-phosphate pyrophosphokinase, partial [Oscillospiraceae bacterium]|nr:ribose-phosphate pyrophosphokinase [Oscillospiraceae bacterium]
NALDRLAASPIRELTLLDPLPFPADQPAGDKIKYLSVAPVFAEAIERIYEEVSISTLFE